MLIEQVDPRHDSVFAEWFSVMRAAEEDTRPGEPGILLHEERLLTLEGQGSDPDDRQLLLLARDDAGPAVGSARLSLPQRDNPHLGELELAVHPAARRRGVGRALAGEVERLMRQDGRTTLLAYVDEPPSQQGHSAGRAFAAALGWAWAQEEVARDLDLPVDPQRAAELEQTCAPYAVDYAIRTWRHRCPDELLEDRALLMRRMSTDVPLGEIDLQEEEWDGARVRRVEQCNAGMDRGFFSAGAVHRPTGRLVAFTDMSVPRSVPERAYQCDTIVLKEHRGHRLGTLVKLAALQSLAAGSPRTRYISTWNAEENTPMIAVNEALGARTNGRSPCFQRVLAVGEETGLVRR